MSPADREARKRALQARRDALRDKMKARRRQAFKQTGRPSRLWWLVVLAVLILLALLCCNPCTPPPVEDVVDVTVVVPDPALPDTDGPAPPPPLPDLPRIPRQARPAMPVQPPGPPSWLDAFRLQVTARSPRLAACFEGSEHPGQLRWTTSIEPVQGSVSEHRIEPMLDTDVISAREKTCLLGVLSSPRYELRTGDEPSTPTRTSLVIAF